MQPAPHPYIGEATRPVSTMKQPNGSMIAITDGMKIPAATGVYFYSTSGRRSGAVVVDPPARESQLDRMSSTQLAEHRSRLHDSHQWQRHATGNSASLPRRHGRCSCRYSCAFFLPCSVSACSSPRGGGSWHAASSGSGAVASLPIDRAAIGAAGPGHRRTLGGLVGSADAVVLAGSSSIVSRFMLIITDGLPDAERWLSDLRTLRAKRRLRCPAAGFGEAEPHMEVAGRRRDSRDRLHDRRAVAQGRRLRRPPRAGHRHLPRPPDAFRPREHHRGRGHLVPRAATA